MKILILVAFALAVAGADDDCYFNPQLACDRCPWDRSYVHYVANECNCTTFYLCERRSDGVIVPHEQYCNPCFCFSNDDWTCSIRIKDKPCPTAPPPVTNPAPPVRPSKNFFCMDFDNDYRDQKVYYNVKPSCRIVNVSEQYSPDDIYRRGLKIEKKALLSDGSTCDVEIPYFQNNEFNQFTFCGLFVFYDDNPIVEEMGLVFNGGTDDCYPGSIKILLTADRKLQAGIQTAGGIFEITNGKTVSSYSPHKVCLRYDGSQRAKSLQLVVDGYEETRNFADGSSGYTIPQKCNLRVGEVLEKYIWLWGFNYKHYGFKGILDTWCFSPSIVDESFFTSP